MRPRLGNAGRKPYRRTAPGISPRAQASSSARSRSILVSPGAGASMISASASMALIAVSDIESNVNDIAVAHHVIATLEPLLAALPQAGVRPGSEQFLGVGHLGADESAGEIGVDAGGRVQRGLALAQIPGAHLGIAGGEERDQPEQAECAPRHPVQARLLEAAVMKK